MVDDFSAPLGQQPVKQRRRLPIAVPHVIAGVRGCFSRCSWCGSLSATARSAGEPAVTVPLNLQPVKVVTKPEATAPPQPTTGVQAPGPYVNPAATEVPASAPSPNQAAPAGTRTVTIIDGNTGARQEVVIPAAPSPSISEAGEKLRQQ